MRFAFVEVEKVTYPVSVLCRVLEVSRPGFYAWLRRSPSAGCGHFLGRWNHWRSLHARCASAAASG